jgi:hypothetical protein
MLACGRSTLRTPPTTVQQQVVISIEDYGWKESKSLWGGTVILHFSGLI